MDSVGKVFGTVGAVGLGLWLWYAQDVRPRNVVDVPVLENRVGYLIGDDPSAIGDDLDKTLQTVEQEREKAVAVDDPPKSAYEALKKGDLDSFVTMGLQIEPTRSQNMSDTAKIAFQFGDYQKLFELHLEAGEFTEATMAFGLKAGVPVEQLRLLKAVDSYKHWPDHSVDAFRDYFGENYSPEREPLSEIESSARLNLIAIMLQQYKNHPQMIGQLQVEIPLLDDSGLYYFAEQEHLYGSMPEVFLQMLKHEVNARIVGSNGLTYTLPDVNSALEELLTPEAHVILLKHLVLNNAQSDDGFSYLVQVLDKASDQEYLAEVKQLARVKIMEMIASSDRKSEFYKLAFTNSSLREVLPDVLMVGIADAYGNKKMLEAQNNESEARSSYDMAWVLKSYLEAIVAFDRVPNNQMINGIKEHLMSLGVEAYEDVKSIHFPKNMDREKHADLIAYIERIKGYEVPPMPGDEMSLGRVGHTTFLGTDYYAPFTLLD
jgi:hypothetical protein